MLSKCARLISRFVASLHANTLDNGVRFRAHKAWTQLLEAIRFQVASFPRGVEEKVSLARRLLLVRSCRRDSFLLVRR